VWLAPRFDEIPPELRALGWVLWAPEQRGDGKKPTKVPRRVQDHRRNAKSTDPATWATFADAVQAYAELRDDDTIGGIGCVLTTDARITCIDLDDVLAADGTLDTRAQTIVDTCDSFTEISPSGTGLHVFVLGTLPRALGGPHIEVYSTARYIAVTGHRWPGTPSTLRSRQDYLDYLVRLNDESTRPARPYSGPSVAPPDDLAGALLAKLERWGVRVLRLKRWSDGYLAEIAECPWSYEHTTGGSDAAVLIRASGAWDYVCHHAHCAGRGWREFRDAMDPR
jgi:primase-polymerase (primpol)-like protein